jgi:hypothetical protein
VIIRRLRRLLLEVDPHLGARNLSGGATILICRWQDLTTKRNLRNLRIILVCVSGVHLRLGFASIRGLPVAVVWFFIYSRLFASIRGSCFYLRQSAFICG